MVLRVGATLAYVQLMQRNAGAGIGVKAAGGIRTLADAMAMIETRTIRIGASTTIIISQLDEE